VGGFKSGPVPFARRRVSRERGAWAGGGRGRIMRPPRSAVSLVRTAATTSTSALSSKPPSSCIRAIPPPPQWLSRW
jgi:hypothetical protein